MGHSWKAGTIPYTTCAVPTLPPAWRVCGEGDGQSALSSLWNRIEDSRGGSVMWVSLSWADPLTY